MSLGVNFNIAAVRTHQNLVSADRVLSRVFDRLSTGVRLRSAADDPSSLVLANTLRYQIRGLTQATQNAEEGVNMLQTADASLDEVANLLNRMRQLAVSAGNEAVQDPSSLQALQDELDQAVTSVTRIATNTRYGSIPLLNGAVSGNQLSTTAQDRFTAVDFDGAYLPGGIQAKSALNIVMPPLGVNLDRDTVGVDLSAVAGVMSPAGGPDSGTLIADLFQDPLGSNEQLSTVPSTVTIATAKGSKDFTITASTTIADFVSQINANSSLLGVQADYSAGHLRVESTAYGAGGLTISGTQMGATQAGLLDSDVTTATNDFATPGTNKQIQLNYKDASGISRLITLDQDPAGDGLTFTNLNGGPETMPPFTAYAPKAFSVKVKDTSGGIPGSTVAVPFDTTYSASRVSTIRIQVGAESGQSVDVDLPDSRASALGWSAGLVAQGFGTLQSLSNGAVLKTGNAQAALKVIDAAVDEIATARGRLGAIQSNAIESTLNALRVTAENLTASESRLRDTDFALESANFAKQNMLYQAATSMLAQANQVPQTVLRLLDK